MNMKLTLALIALTAFLFTGCATTGQSNVTVNDFAPAIKTAAYAGSWYALKEHPEWREGFTIAAQDLQILEESEVIDFATLLAIVNRLPVKELKSEEAAVAITGATILLNQYGDKVISLDKLQNIKPVASAIRQGIELALK